MRALIAFFALTLTAPVLPSSHPTLAVPPAVAPTGTVSCQPKVTRCPWNVCGQLDTGCGSQLACRTGCYLVPVVAAGATAVGAVLFLLIR